MGGIKKRVEKALQSLNKANYSDFFEVLSKDFIPEEQLFYYNILKNQFKQNVMDEKY